MAEEGKLLKCQSGWMAYCPGCDEYHVFDERWTMTGTPDNPSFTPSLLVTHPDGSDRCHSFLKNGQWEFLSDCHHELAGQTVPLTEPPEDRG